LVWYGRLTANTVTTINPSTPHPPRSAAGGAQTVEVVNVDGTAILYFPLR
jgi:hypothetical protein